MNEQTYMLAGDDAEITTMVYDYCNVVHAQGEFVIARVNDSHNRHNAYFLADDQPPESFSTEGGFAWRGHKYLFISGWPGIDTESWMNANTLPTCLELINVLKPPPDPFLNHEL